MMSKSLMKLLESSSKNSKVLMTLSETNNTMKLELLMTKDSDKECSVLLKFNLDHTLVLVDGKLPSLLDFDLDFIIKIIII